MRVSRRAIVTAAIGLFAALAPACRAADAAREHATAREVVEKVRDAAAMLAQKGEAGLKLLNEKSPPYVWKDSYVFVSDCARGIILAHPFQPDRVGKRIADGPTYGGMTAAQRAEAQCAAARKPGGGWWAYSFSRPGAAKATRKVSYMMMVPGHTWLVGAGVYDATTPIAKFEAISRAAP